MFPPFKVHRQMITSQNSIPQLDPNNSAVIYSHRFPDKHLLNSSFIDKYHLKDELGAGGYGFVMTAIHRQERHEVAVKFIVKDKVPEHAWMEDENIGKLPCEVMLLCCIDHPNIVKCLDIYDDNSFIYMVQELHGSPWHPYPSSSPPLPPPEQAIHPSRSLSPMPSTSSKISTKSGDSGRSITPPPQTPPGLSFPLDPLEHDPADLEIQDKLTPPPPTKPAPSTALPFSPETEQGLDPTDLENRVKLAPPPIIKLDTPEPSYPKKQYTRRPSYDLFECIEQSEEKRLTEEQARRTFAQVVNAVAYLDSLGITHGDIKDENLVIDKDFNVKLIDFGSAIIVDCEEPRPTYTQFYGTAAYASSEILKRKPYKAAPAEVWTLGILLSYLVIGYSPFPTVQDAVDGHIVINHSPSLHLSPDYLQLLSSCLDINPDTRIPISQIKKHRWLQGA